MSRIKMLVPQHEIKTQDPLGKADPFSWPPDDERFGNMQDVPRYSTFRSHDINAVPQKPKRSK